MDNKIFNVNGKSKEMLQATLNLVFEQGRYKKAVNWSIHPDKGLILYWAISKKEKVNDFVTSVSADTVCSTVWEWLQSDEAWEINLTGWDVDQDHDGSNSKGWRVYVEDWGHVNDDWSAICAIKPIYLWHGK